jgi:CHASE2 domain-containing sensor protein/serine phosphatase RsbU (regulator of sigma subunit)
MMFAGGSVAALLRNAVFDGYQRWFPLTRTAAPVVIVNIDEASLAELGQWPWPRTRVAELIQRIESHRPAAIGVDLFFPEPDRFSPALLAEALPLIPGDLADALKSFPSTDAALAAAVAQSNVVLGVAGMPTLDVRFPYPPRNAPIKIGGKRELMLKRYPGHLQTLPEIDRRAKGRGLMSNDSSDGVIRTAPLLAMIQNTLVASLGLETLRVASGGQIVVVDQPGGGVALKLAELTIPIQRDGTVWIRYSRHDPARFVSAAEVMNGKVDPQRLADKVVLLGLSGLGLLDHRITALGESVPGVEIHAQLIEQMLAGVDLARPRWAAALEVLLLTLAGVLVIVYAPRFRVQRVWAVVGMATLLWVALCIAAFLHGGVLIDFAWPLAGVVVALAIMQAGALAVSDRAQRVLREGAARATGELGAGQRIQMGLLPNPANLFGGDTRFSLAAALAPARTVGGDFYDCFWLDSNRVFFAVADVSGKGLPAALFMAASKSNLKSAVLLNNGDLSAALKSMDDELSRQNPEQLFITIFAAVLDARQGTLTTINAGHDAPLLWREGQVAALERASGPPLGVVEALTYEVQRVALQPGDRLLVITDGITEAIDAKGRFFGAERLMHSFEQLGSASPEQIVVSIKAEVDAFAAGVEAADDLTLMCLEWRA